MQTIWEALIEQLAEQPGGLDVLVVADRHNVISDVIIPEMMQRAPEGSRMWNARHEVTLPNGTRIQCKVITNEMGADYVRGCRFDLIVYDPHWMSRHSAALREQIDRNCRRVAVG
jgi:hypothetical protein